MAGMGEMRGEDRGLARGVEEVWVGRRGVRRGKKGKGSIGKDEEGGGDETARGLEGYRERVEIAVAVDEGERGGCRGAKDVK